MRASYQSLRLASRIRPRRSLTASGRVLAAILGLGIVASQGSPLGNGERAQAEPLAQTGAIVQAAVATSAGDDDAPRIVRTIRVTSSDDLFAAPRSVVSCDQPSVATWRLRALSDSGCGSIPLQDPAEAAPAAQPRAAVKDAARSPDRSSPDEETAALMNDPAPLAGGSPSPARPSAESPARSGPVKLLGVWQPRRGCSKIGPRGDCIPLVIDARGAKAGPASCRFLDKRQTGNRFAIRAECSSGGETWTANVRLIVAGNRLTWTSERGSQEYAR